MRLSSDASGSVVLSLLTRAALLAQGLYQKITISRWGWKMIRRTVPIILSLFLFLLVCDLNAEKASTAAGLLRGVKTVQVDPTVVPKADKIKEEAAPNLVRDSLKNAFRLADIQVAEEAPVRAHIVLDEFSSGSMAKRFVVGFGAGRSSITCRLVIEDADGKEISNTKMHVRGNLVWSPYQGNNTQRKQAVGSLDQKLLEEIEKMK